ncbi:MAG TPA: hypothetical protein VMB73_26630 [Acetobacteraceae bacterium]|jgi:hypothetical protein|nr:hypothetical protein [Acetobacteraceae bacterium]
MSDYHWDVRCGSGFCRTHSPAYAAWMDGFDDGDDGDRALQSLSAAIRSALDQDIDPYAVIGVLIEGAAVAVADSLPRKERAEAGVALVRLLQERLKAHGVRQSRG